ncbi:acetamidase/formamidase family protein [Brevibacillus centrosporus]|uniref:acetamidase/formamidase family protein n=1 Tax=Brevibacillus centrosporus TaxID=54910 RepID=UPI000F0A0E3D|nr:acetamidase/formamidase family protein [Brevibacillus centrosporus]MEC2129235.1 acetamidase/formamidase family protein [Brevibacillus centrosporus]RNB70423.1 acetamidase/formamidase family protein [Brevibacillus centrosporus]GED29468.1 acetamidase [Brevibacillus centrosporus]
MEKAKAQQTVYVNSFVNGILDPEKAMLGPVRDGGFIVANTTPGCWGPMITPALRGGHEVTQPVYVEGANVGDAIAIRIKSIQVTSMVTASGNERTMEGRFLGDPFVAAKCPGCGTLYPETKIEGIGPEAIRCVNCGAETTPFTFTNGYTIGFNETKELGVTLPQKAAEKIAQDGRYYMNTPEQSQQNPIVTFAPHDLVGVVARVRPFLGQLGTTPSHAIPDSHNAGDFGAFLVGAPHEYALTQEQLDQHKTDGHMDINRVRENAILICPVKVPGGGVYLGDMHAMQGDGEIAGHTTDVSGIVTLQVHVIPGLSIDGPVLLPVEEDLPYLAKPFTAEEKAKALHYAKTWELDKLEESLPLSVIGTGANLNVATENGLQRAADLLEMTVPEVLNRATITGAIQIGRHPGVVTVTFLAPVERLEKIGLLELAKEQYSRYIE